MKKYEKVVAIWRIWIISYLFHYNIREADLLLAGLCSLISSRLPSCNKYPSFLAKIVFSIKWTGLFWPVNRFISGTLPFLKKVSIWYDCAPWPSAQSGFFFVQKKLLGLQKIQTFPTSWKTGCSRHLLKKYEKSTFLIERSSCPGSLWCILMTCGVVLGKSGSVLSWDPNWKTCSIFRDREQVYPLELSRFVVFTQEIIWFNNDEPQKQQDRFSDDPIKKYLKISNWPPLGY